MELKRDSDFYKECMCILRRYTMVLEPLNYIIYDWNDNVQNKNLQFLRVKSIQLTSLAS